MQERKYSHHVLPDLMCHLINEGGFGMSLHLMPSYCHYYHHHNVRVAPHPPLILLLVPMGIIGRRKKFTRFSILKLCNTYFRKKSSFRPDNRYLLLKISPAGPGQTRMYRAKKIRLRRLQGTKPFIQTRRRCDFFRVFAPIRGETRRRREIFGCFYTYT